MPRWSESPRLSKHSKQWNSKKRRSRGKSKSLRRAGKDGSGLGLAQEQGEDEGWLVSLSVNEPQQRGFVYNSQLNQRRKLWLHSVVSTDGPNATIHLTALPPEIPQTVGSPAASNSSTPVVHCAQRGCELSPCAHKKTTRPQAVPKRTLNFQLNLAEVGISFVDHRPREVCKRLELNGVVR